MHQTINFRQFSQTINNVSKKAAITMAMLLTLGMSYSFAARPEDAVSRGIRISFKQRFQNAVIIDTEVKAVFTKLTFKMNDAVMFAFYSNSGELLAVTRNIVSSRLPMNLLVSLRNEYSTHWITELFEFNADDVMCYYVSMESADRKITLRSNGDGWEVYSSVKK
jgi:hypothetical protein